MFVALVAFGISSLTSEVHSYTPCVKDLVDSVSVGKIGLKIVHAGKNIPLGNYPINLSPLEIEWKKLHSKTILMEIFGLETKDFFSPLRF